MSWILLLSLLILTGCSKPRPIFVTTALYILEKDGKVFKIIESSTGLSVQEATRRAPDKIIGLTKGKLKQLKDKIISQAKQIEKLKRE